MQSSLQGVHAQGDVHSWAVGEEGGESSLHEQAEDQDPVSETEQAEIKQQLRLPSPNNPPPDSRHALLEQRVPPGFADDEIGPLDDHDAAEEGGVAGELDDLPLLVGLRGGTTPGV